MPPKTRTQHADMIEQALDRLDLQKQQLSDHVGINLASVSKWLSRTHPVAVPPKHWGLICDLLRIPLKKWIEAAQEDVPENVIIYNRLVRSLSRRPR